MIESLSQEKGQLVINEIQIRKAELILKAIDHDLREKILRFIDEQEEVPVTAIYKTLAIEQSVASQHLSVLRKAGFVTPKRVGKQILYSINYSRMDEVQAIIHDFLNKD